MVTTDTAPAPTGGRRPTPQPTRRLRNRVKELRLKRDMTADGLANLAGISRFTLGAIENDTEAWPSGRTMMMICEALDAPFADVWYEDPSAA